MPYLAALSSPPTRLAYRELRPPSRSEARRYLQQKLPSLSPERLEAVLNQGGRNYGELSRLVLLEMTRSGDESERDLATDPCLGPLLRALTVLSPEADPVVPVALLETILAKSLKDATQAERALLEPVDDGFVRPAIRAALFKDVPQAREIHAEALHYYRAEGDLPWQLYHARGAGAHRYLLEIVDADPSRLALLPGLGAQARDWLLDEREALALALLRYQAVQGNYEHQEAVEALERFSISSGHSRKPPTPSAARISPRSISCCSTRCPAPSAARPRHSSLEDLTRGRNARHTG